MVVEIAATHGLSTPLVARLVQLVHEIEDGTRPMDRRNLDALAKGMR
jgi:2-dehydropantoate 2-reductase